ncbi:MAG: ABC transporter permease [Clostridia bacterium]|nr:ABC transporter permease [Clostridia bacterium]
MSEKILKCFKRTLLPAVAILLLVAMFTVIVCAVSESEEDISYTVTVTSPSGKNTDSFIVESWVLDLFTKEEPLKFYNVTSANTSADALNMITSGNAPFVEVSLAEYVKDVQVSLKRAIYTINSNMSLSADLIGITSLSCDPRLLPQNGCQIKWAEGYDESILGDEGLYCIIPEGMAQAYNNGNGGVDMYFKNTIILSTTIVDGKPSQKTQVKEYRCTPSIVGTYTGGDGKSIYCPASVVRQIFGELGDKLFYRSLSATLADNSRLEEFREKMKLCFTEPSEDAGETLWGYMLVREVDGITNTRHYISYPYALDIRDSRSIDQTVIPNDTVPDDTVPEETIPNDTVPDDSEKLPRNVIAIILVLAVGALLVILTALIRRNRIKFAHVRIVTLVLIAASVITISALCVLNEVKLREQEQAVQSSPITVTVEGRTASISSWTIDLFTGKNPVEITDRSSGSSVTTQVSLSEYLKDVRIKMSKKPQQINGSGVTTQISGQYPYLVGITSIPSDERLLRENGCEITWYDGYDETVFGSEELVCLVPSGKAEAYDNGSGEAVLYFYYAWGRMENGTYVEVSRTEYECTLKIVGTYTAGDEMSFYCPFSIIEQVYAGLDEKLSPDSISATLTDNLLLDEFCEKASRFYSNLLDDPKAASKVLNVSNRSKNYTGGTDNNALDINKSNEIDISALREENDRFNRTAIRIIAILALIAVLLLVLPMIFKRIMRGREVRILKPKEVCGLILKLIAGFAKGCIVLIRHTINRMKRSPVRVVAVLLFAAVITMIICALKASNDEEMRHYEKAYQAIPIKFTVTQPSVVNEELGWGSLMPGWILDLFTGESPVEIVDVSAAKDWDEKQEIIDNTEPTKISLQEYVKDLQFKMTYSIRTINGKKYTGARGTTFLYGMNSIYSDKQLLPEYGCEIKWYDGYDESIFSGDEPVCLIPESKATADHYDNGGGEAELYFSYQTRTMVNGVSTVVKSGEYECKLKIVGTYTAGDELSIYCPFSIIEQVYDELEKEYRIDSLSGMIADNMRLEEFLEKADMFFMDPSKKDEEIPWGIVVFNREDEYPNEFYLYAMDINDEHLAELSAILQESIKFNRFVTVLVVILSVISGFLIGFLMIRRRKRDIILMRTVGESNFRLYIGFVLEQMICVILGIAVGGAYYKWNPMDKLILFAIVYFVALTLALAIFMSKKLIKNIKEDE